MILTCTEERLSYVTKSKGLSKPGFRVSSSGYEPYWYIRAYSHQVSVLTLALMFALILGIH